MIENERLQAEDAECAEGRNAPRVSLEDIQNGIAFRCFVTGRQAVSAVLHDAPAPASLDVLTMCLVVMTNGFTIIGKSAPASPTNFDRELGRKLAEEDAVRQIWPLMAFALRDRLARAEA